MLHVLARWEAEGSILAKTSFGVEVLRAVGNSYGLSAVQFLGATGTGRGMPSIARWAKAQKASLDEESLESEATMGVASCFFKAIKTGGPGSETPGWRLPNSVMIFWSTSVVDIMVTLHEAVEKALYDQSAPPPHRLKRAESLVILGNCWKGVVAGSPVGHDFVDCSRLFRRAAFVAQVETMRRREEACFHALVEHD